MTWTKYRTITVDHTKVITSDKVNFTFPVAGTVAGLKTVGNGGFVVNGPYDIQFFGDAGLTSSPLKFERVSWDGTTGAHVFYVKVSALSASVDTVIYMAYGNAAVTTDQQDAANTWATIFGGVYHGSATDSTVNAKNLTATAAPTTVAGLIGNARHYNGSTQYDSRAAIAAAEPYCISTLFRVAALANGAIAGQSIAANAAYVDELTLQSTGALRALSLGPANATTATGLIAINTWCYGAGRWNAAADRWARANATAPTQDTTASTNAGPPDTFYVGARAVSGTHNNFLAQDINEIRFYNADPGDDWLATEENSLVGIATFYALGAETSPATLALSVTQQPSTVASGAAISPAVTVQLSDSAAGVTVTMALASGLGALSGTLTAVSNGAGLATFANLVVTGGGAHTLTATAPSYTSITTSSFTVTNTVMAANQAFIDANGLDAKWLGVMDYRVNIPDDGTGKATQLNEVRGSGVTSCFPATQATQSKRAVIGGSGLVFTAANLSHYLTALDSRMKLTNTTSLHVLMVLQSPDGSAFPAVLSTDATDQTVEPYMALSTNASKYGAQVNPGPSSTTNQTVMDAGTAFDATKRAVRLTRRKNFILTSGQIATGDNCYQVQVAGRQMRQKMTLPDASTTASGMALAIARFDTKYCGMTLQWIGVSTQDWSKTFRESWYSFVQAQFNVTLDSSQKGTLYYDGSSVPRGHNTTHPHGYIPADTGTTSPPYTWETIAPTLASKGFDGSDIDAYSPSSNGRGLVDAVAMLSVHIGAEPDTRRSGPQVITEELLVNSFRLTYVNAGDAITAETDFTAYIASLYAAGFTSIVLQTCIDWGDWYTPPSTGTINQKGTNVLTFNAWLRTVGITLPGVVGLIDWDALDPVLLRFKTNRAVLNPGIGTNATSDTTYYLTGNWHPTDTGAALLGTLARGYFDANPSILALSTAGSLGKLGFKLSLGF